MKAPEKLYIALDELTENGHTSVLDHRVDYPICTEYTRTDAFIEKAAAWLDENLLNYWSQACADSCNFIEDFKNYMKG